MTHSKRIEDKFDKLIEILERVAVALEWINTKTPNAVFTTTPPPSTYGYTCQICYLFVPAGTTHSCAGGTYTKGSG